MNKWLHSGRNFKKHRTNKENNCWSCVLVMFSKERRWSNPCQISTYSQILGNIRNFIEFCNRLFIVRQFLRSLCSLMPGLIQVDMHISCVTDVEVKLEITPSLLISTYETRV